MRLTARAPGKINLCLFLGPTRGDGRHELVTLLESVSLADELELSVLEDDHGPDRVICEGVEGPNLAARALSELRARGWEAPPVQLTIAKRIPVAAGMGGGSADAAATLRLAVEVTPGRPEEVAALAAELGSDVPSQLAPGLALATGAGETVEPFEPLTSHAFLILPQPYALSTAEVYREADRLGSPRERADLVSRYDELAAVLQPGGRPPDELIVNDLELAAVSLCPPVKGALNAATAAGADRALVSGSGPTVAGLFWGTDAPQRATAAATGLAERFPGATCATPVGPEFGSPQFARCSGAHAGEFGKI
jgi:4-diphosphocytidyl-2-C-methyl-D-erythritol kinase